MKASDLLALPADGLSEIIDRAVRAYPKAVTGHFNNCKHPGAVLRYVLACPADRGRELAANYITTLHGAAWNAMCDSMSANAWLVWYAGDSAREKLPT